MARLFDPLSVRSLRLKNRLVVPPMRSRKAANDGTVSDQLLQHYVNLSDGPGLVMVEHAYVVDWGRLSPQLGISNDRYIPGLAKLVRAIHDRGAATVLEMSHVGSMAGSGDSTVLEISGIKPTAPSVVVNPRSMAKSLPRAMTNEDIKELIHGFAQAARRGVEAGFDGVEVHCGHGFLLSEFMSPITNLRQDEYGGSPENRIRLAAQIVRVVREGVGKDYPIFCRFASGDYLLGGLELQDSITMAHILASTGVDVLDVAGGLGGIEPPDKQQRGEGYFVAEAEAIRKATDAIVIGVGGISTPQFADKLLRQGRVDLLAVGRTMLKDPTWCKNALEIVKEGKSDAS